MLQYDSDKYFLQNTKKIVFKDDKIQPNSEPSLSNLSFTSEEEEEPEQEQQDFES